ncbi:MAG: serine/threonine-protein kinase [Oscillospiraceae bacterium]|nr:serine/threonine-protein kinase [Oscillospiraceae bacterium]
MLSNGYILDKRYRIDGIVGRGGLSVVYKASDLQANMAVRAVKEVSKRCAEAAESAKQESVLIKELYERDKYNFFPNIIQRIENNDALFIVMDFIDGKSMNVLLSSGPLSFKNVIEYGKDICSVIAFINDYGKIYSDMKPDNLMILSSDSNIENLDKSKKYSNLKLIDFGAVIQSETGTAQYTPEYAAPEQYRQKSLDKRTDIFNIGATLYHMTTGEKPVSIIRSDGGCRNSYERFVFDSKSKNINAELRRIILRCVNDNPDMRYKSCKELYHALDSISKRTHIKLTALSCSLAVFFSLTFAFSTLKCKSMTKSDYNNYMTIAQKATSYNEKIAAYTSAVKLNGDQTDAYFGLVETYKEDVSFSEDESSALLKLTSEHSQTLKEDPSYQRLAFEIGKLYWYYYDYGSDNNSDNETTRITSSTKWFSEAIDDSFRQANPENYQMAQIYYDIGTFYSNIQKMVIEGSDSQVYSDYWSSINQMVEFVDVNHTETEIVLLETYKLAMNALKAYTYKFSLFVSYDDQMKLFESIKDKTDSINASTDKTRQIKDDITRNYDSIISSIKSSYDK